MLYRVLRPFTFAGANYMPGDVLDLGDQEQATQMLRAARGAVEEMTAAASRVAPAPAFVPLPQPELRQTKELPVSKPRKGRARYSNG